MDLKKLADEVLGDPRITQPMQDEPALKRLSTRNRLSIRHLLKQFMREMVKLTDEQLGEETTQLDAEAFDDWRHEWGMDVVHLVESTKVSDLRNNYAQELAQRGISLERAEALLASFATIAATLAGVFRVGATAEQYYDA